MKKQALTFIFFSCLLVCSSKAQITNYVKATTEGKVTISSDGTIPAFTDDAKQEYDLFVKRGILTKTFGIYPTSFWADHVFENDYRLMDLHSLKSFINLNGHLPEVPSQKQIAKKGYKVHEMNVIFLKKIEELTLYILQLENRLKIIEENEN